MSTILLLLAWATQVVAPGEIQCLGFIHDSRLPMEAYISGMEKEGSMSLAVHGTLVYVGGPGAGSLREGETYSVVRPEGFVRHQRTHEPVGYYHKELGNVRIESIRGGTATATVLSSCNAMRKGDLIVPVPRRTGVDFELERSDSTTFVDESGLTSSIVLGKDDFQWLAAGHFCFIGIGAREGVKVGDRFTIYRPQPAFNPNDMLVGGSGKAKSYQSLDTAASRAALQEILQERRLPPRVLGDLVIVDVSETTATGKIVHSLTEIHPGDRVVRK